MGLRCLLGHDFGNREVERERQEDGNEVVVTYRTVETCQRCGDRRIVSENKEVRSIRSGEEMQTGLGASVTAEADAVEGDADVDAESVEDPADAIDVAEAETASAAEEASAAEAASTAEADAADAEPTAEEDDGIILTDDGSSGERERGQWPDADVNERTAEPDPAPTTDDAVVERSAGSQPTDDAAEQRDRTPADEDTAILGSDDDWPEHEREDEGFDAEAGGGSGTDVSFGGGLTPESSADAAANGEATFADAPAADESAEADKEFVRAADADVDIDRSEPGTRTEFYCPNCGLSRLAGASSMRAGDICPDCRKGYIAEREA